MSSGNSRTGYRAVVMQVSSIGGKESFEVQHHVEPIEPGSGHGVANCLCNVHIVSVFKQTVVLSL